MMNKPFFDHRIYTIHPRCMPKFLDVFATLAMPVLRKHLGEPVGFYVSSIGTLNQVVHLWGYDSLDDYQKRSHARDTDPEFQKYLNASEGLILSQESQIVRPVHFKEDGS
ncbi:MULTISPECIES: NIPSNAP family protein [unclassified Acinetobacter]|uniref:NIPSNAP family protein n=1 Tax=unclassified Acinetobacter TaxID=196816 RepID=UPI002934ADCB|nr:MULTISPECIES: NIPSNAP family protein [unclassified Acinetobacter]WOE32496.1 NIPSNAP family protein [Acinetobacter sp. SAAs470]WOE37972.1 NIPSNAP family protein [Acinetobacter sp. SAAs474]